MISCLKNLKIGDVLIYQCVDKERGFYVYDFFDGEVWLRHGYNVQYKVSSFKNHLIKKIIKAK